jgi:hypothetical protein
LTNVVSINKDDDDSEEQWESFVEDLKDNTTTFAGIVEFESGETSLVTKFKDPEDLVVNLYVLKRMIEARIDAMIFNGE